MTVPSQDPAVIAQKRAERALKKTLRDARPPKPDAPFIHRDMQKIKDGKGLTVMTYNVLAQSLIRRKLFPDSGDSIKWSHRQKVLQSELSHYNPRLMCLQEMGDDMMSTMGPWMTSQGYDFIFERGRGKRHGLIIAWRDMKLKISRRVDYDQLGSEEPGDENGEGNQNGKEGQKGTNNIGLLCILDDGTRLLTLATTHLFWHPRGTCERARQASILIREVHNFDARYGEGNIIIAGDFNTEPIDPTYLAMTRRPYDLDSRGREIMEESARHKSSWFAEEDSDETAESEPDQAGSVNWQASLDALSSGPQMTSFYGSHYRDNERVGEPECTNYAHVYRGCLDYLFTPARKDRFECLGVLEMPDLALLTHGQPEEGKCCSDHFSLLVELAYKT